MSNQYSPNAKGLTNLGGLGSNVAAKESTIIRLSSDLMEQVNRVNDRVNCLRERLDRFCQNQPCDPCKQSEQKGVVPGLAFMVDASVRLAHANEVLDDLLNNLEI